MSFPSKLHNTKKWHNFRQFTCIAEKVNDLIPKSWSWLGDDFNARTGLGNTDLLDGQNRKEGYIMEERVWQDNIINKPGRKFLKFLSLSILYLLNGSSYNICGKRFTYLSAFRTSLTGYFVALRIRNPPFLMYRIQPTVKIPH